MFRFEKFEVWQQSVAFADRVYACTRGFPSDGQFGLTSQMRRAAVSVSSNIAEGSSRSSDKDFARFVEVAYGSLMEVVSQASVASRQSLIDEPQFKTLYDDAEQIARKLSALRNTLRCRQGISYRIMGTHIAVGNALRGVPGPARTAVFSAPGTPRRAFPTERHG